MRCFEYHFSFILKWNGGIFLKKYFLIFIITIITLLSVSTPTYSNNQYLDFDDDDLAKLVNA